MLSFAKRGIAAVGLTAALIGTLAAPAFAAPSDAELAVFTEDLILLPGSEGQEITPLLLASEPVEITDAVMTVDFTGLAKVASVKPTQPDSCKVAGSVMTCKLWQLEELDWFTSLDSFVVTPVAGADPDASGELKVTFSAAGVDPVSYTSEVMIGEGVDLAAGPELKKTVAAGAKFGVDLGVANAGETTAAGTVALFDGRYAVTAGEKRYSNCFYTENILQYCVFEDDLKPGASYVSDEPMPMQLSAFTPAPAQRHYSIGWQTPAEWALMLKLLKELGIGTELGKPGTEDPLRLVENTTRNSRGVQVDTDPSNNWGQLALSVTGKNQHDFTAIGATGTGRAGDIVELDLGLHNVGTAAADRTLSTDAVAVAAVTLPAGTSLTEMPQDCYAKDGSDNITGRVFHCLAPFIMLPDEKAIFTFKLRIDKVVPDAKGTIHIGQSSDPEKKSADHNPANDRATIIFNSTGGTGGGDELPTTGVQVGLIAAAGAALLAAGAIVSVLARRRRVTFAE